MWFSYILIVNFFILAILGLGTIKVKRYIEHFWLENNQRTCIFVMGTLSVHILLCFLLTLFERLRMLFYVVQSKLLNMNTFSK